MTETKFKRLLKKEFLEHLGALTIDDYTKNLILENGKIILIRDVNKIQLGGVFKAHGKLFGDYDRDIGEIKEHSELIKMNIENAKKIDTIIPLDD